MDEAGELYIGHPARVAARVCWDDDEDRLPETRASGPMSSSECSLRSSTRYHVPTAPRASRLMPERLPGTREQVTLRSGGVRGHVRAMPGSLPSVLRGRPADDEA